MFSNTFTMIYYREYKIKVNDSIMWGNSFVILYKET